MSYLDRLRTAKYTSPSGAVSTFEFRKLTRSLAHKAAVQELPQQNVADVQDLGLTAPRFALQCIFVGTDYDLAADAFVTALSEKHTPQSPGTLGHPRWGDIPVCPIGIGQSESFTEDMGQAVIEVEFVRMNAVPFPATSASAQTGIQSDLGGLQTSAANAMGNGLIPAGPQDSAICQTNLTGLANGLPAQMAQVTANDPSVGPSLASQVSAFTSGLAAQMSNGSNVCNSVITMMQIPAVTQLCPALLKVQSFANVVSSLVATTVNLPKTIAQAFTHALGFVGAMIGQMSSALAGALPNRGDAVGAALSIQFSLATVMAGVSTDEGAVPGYVMPPDVMAILKDLANRSAAALMAQSFALPTAHYLTLTANHNPLTLCYQIFGDVSDADLANLYAWNGFPADMNYEIPAGTTVVYYA